MLYINTHSTKPYINLAFEEYFFKNEEINEPIFMLWQNEPTIVIGRFQNSIEEINQKYVMDNNIHVIRRITGGGAVYHDLGNLCYTFILKDLLPESVAFSIFAQPVLEALSKLGIAGEVNGRNDLTIDGAKFSGTAMSLYKQNLLFHGTMLYNSDLSALSQALQVTPDKVQSKGIKSVRSRVTNIMPYLKQDLDISVFRSAFKDTVYKNSYCTEYIPTEMDLKKIYELSDLKYRTWEWNYGNNPKATFHNKKKYHGGTLEVFMNFNKSKIKNCKIYGDFLGLCGIEPIERSLNNVTYERNSIRMVLDNFDLVRHFGTITEDEILACLMGE